MKYLLFIVLLFVGCALENPVTPPISEPPVKPRAQGRLAISYVSGLKKVSQDAADSAAISFNLGEIHGSQNYYFILSNTGDTVIPAVTFNTDIPGVEISPAVIYNLTPQRTSGVIPIIKVAILHGTRTEGGAGHLPLLPDTLGTIPINVHVQTDSSAADSFLMNLNIQVKRANFKIIDTAGVEKNLAKPFTAHQGISYSGGQVYVYKRDTVQLFVNDGSVPLYVEAFTKHATTVRTIDTAASFSVAPGDTAVIPRTSYTYTYYAVGSPKGTTAKQNAFFVDTDGRIYFGLTK